MTETFLFVYASAELILAAQIAISNFLVIFVYLRSKHIRTPTNAYIFSLALTDFLTGALGIPFTVASVLTRWPGSFYPCLAIHLILCVLCTVSTLHLLAMAVDKYLTICLRRFVEQRNSSSTSVRKTRAHFLIVGCWLIGTAIAGLPMVDGFGIRSEERQIKCLLRASERQRRISVRRKLIRILLILVLTYAFCWYPLYLINTVDLFLPPTYHPGQMTTLFAVVLSHLNCALNPLIYAYGMPGFKHSLRRFLPAKVKNTCTQQPSETKENCEGKGELFLEDVVKNEPPQASFPPLNKTSLSLLEMKRENFRLKSKIVFSSFDEQSPPLKHSSTFETEDNPSFNNSFEENNNNTKKVSFVKFKLEKHDECSPTCCDDKQTCLEEGKQNFKLELGKQSLPTCLEEEKHNFKFDLAKQSLPTCFNEEKHNSKFDLAKQSLPTCFNEEKHNSKFELGKQTLVSSDSEGFLEVI
uniref:G-protein coupled receptors family 1 profile domain-containing protein n=1 Tax=Meloidogyne javanica TaxID=6303 RepID=A0A915LRX3_MELJA